MKFGEIRGKVSLFFKFLLKIIFRRKKNDSNEREKDKGGDLLEKRTRSLRQLTDFFLNQR